MIYPDQNEVPLGLFHPEYREQSFRLRGHPHPGRDPRPPAARAARSPGSPVVLLWLAFLVWLATAGLVGVYEGNPLSLVAFQGKAIIYLERLPVAASVPLEQYLARRAAGALPRPARPALALRADRDRPRRESR